MHLDEAWPVYLPGAEAPWNLRRAVHLHRRAGFAAAWPRLQRDLGGEPQDAVTRLLAGDGGVADDSADSADGEVGADGNAAATEFESTARVLADSAVSSRNDRRLKAAWIYRMLYTPDPVGERLALNWHNHFATSNRKVQDLAQMQRQNELLRGLARAPFGELLTAVVRDPAMLVWLDADRNRAGHPNENLARELLELFTLGIGHYTETDVLEAARALTGWRVLSGEFRFDRAVHDDGEKTLLGQTGPLDGDALLRVALAQPATARRVAWRLGRMLLADEVMDEPALESLAAGLRERELDVAWAVETVLRSQRFFSEANVQARIAGPPEYVVGAIRALECLAPPPSTLLLAECLTRMGQDLFYPPGVGGWDEGRAWLDAGAMVARANFAVALVEGRLAANSPRPDLAGLAERHAGTAAIEEAVPWLAELLWGGAPRETTDEVVRLATRNQSDLGDPLRTAAVVLLSRPESHVI